jgi:hypothetical protein
MKATARPKAEQGKDEKRMRQPETRKEKIEHQTEKKRREKLASSRYWADVAHYEPEPVNPSSSLF